MYCNAVYAGYVRIICAKKPEYTLLCTEYTDNLTAGERLRVMRLRAGNTIEQAARAVGVGRRCVMDYELGRVRGMKKDTVTKLCELYNKRKFIIKNQH